MAKAREVKQGDVWTLRLTTGRMVEVRVLGPSRYARAGYRLRQMDSGREFEIRSAGKLRTLQTRKD